MVEICLLGEVTAHVGGRPVDPGPPRQRCVLAALAVEVGRVVPVDRLVERVWGPEVPLRVRGALSSYVSRLRHVLAGSGEVGVVRRSGGYALVVEPSVVDLHRFRELCARARGADDERAEALLAEAVGLWRGEALTGLECGWADAERDRLRGERVAAEDELVDVRLRLGAGEGLVAGLAVRVRERPLDERVAGQYLLALHRAGRTAEALAHYRRVRERLADELGTDPGTALQQLHRQVLAADPALDRTTPATAVPRQLPAAPAPFVGRDGELDRLDTASPSGAAVVISAIAGAGGIGKTWLALHWAHRNLHRFPDGQLFVDLRGFSPEGEPMDPAVAVRGFLDALDVEPGRVPVDPHAQTALFRSLVANRRVLVVLDNAADTDQVTPLLPGSPSCTVLVTSRNRLPGLIAHSAARHVPLDVLTDAEARALLTDRLGAARVAAEPAAVAEVIGSCAGFPLALSIVAGHAHMHPDLPLSALAAELRELGLDALDDGDPAASLPAVLSWSHRALTPGQARAFALLGIAPGPDIGLAAAASLTGSSLKDTGSVLRGLEQASLITRDARGRYRMHDLIRRHAADTAAELPEREREAALRRVVDHYLHTAFAADRCLHQERSPIALDPPAPGTLLRPAPDYAGALAWFDAEHPNLLAAQQTAATLDGHHAAWALAWCLTTFHHRRGHLHARLAAWQVGLVAAERVADPAVHHLAHQAAGRAHADLGRHAEAERHLRRALELAEETGDRNDQARAHQEFTRLWALRGDDRKALEHATHALRLHRGLDRPLGEALCLNLVGWYAARLGEHDRAREHCLAALARYREHREPEGEAMTLDSLGYIDHHTGRHDEAVGHYRQALALFRELGHSYAVADSLDGLGHPCAALGRLEEARELWEEALELYRAQAREEEAARVLRQLGELDGGDGAGGA
ncbi:AfsR/SARP family transcriptional regulator [Saccharothrix syringae]|uniref:Tetratricopeptide repeat protein n=1 Tax=Saccharothrix syringae TaxID=103733 RepID=A0A5Q0H649_SACSY|nr:BTAD domain-containing putative transcriptional regulator [Saccharothrix syringae]QFZ21414.1 tetratricopeptide repeat protein [Saccharothrix syringae]